MLGQPLNEESANKVSDVSSNFKVWINKNHDRIQKATKNGTLPYFLIQQNMVAQAQNKGGHHWPPLFSDSVAHAQITSRRNMIPNADAMRINEESCKSVSPFSIRLM